MAFIDFTLGSSTSFPRVGADRRSYPLASLSTLEVAAADIGARDALSSIRHEGRFIGWVRNLFAFPRTAALADPKLEAIRRLAVAAHLGVDDELVEEERRAQASGVEYAQMATVLARFGRPTFVTFPLNEPPSMAAA